MDFDEIIDKLVKDVERLEHLVESLTRRCEELSGRITDQHDFTMDQIHRIDHLEYNQELLRKHTPGI